MRKLLHLVISLAMVLPLAAQGFGGHGGMGGKSGIGGGIAVAASPTVFQTAATCVAAAAATCNAVLGSAVIAGHRLLVVELSTGNLSTPTMTGESFTAHTGTSGCLDNTGDVIQCWTVDSAVGGQTSTTCTSTITNIMCVVVDITAPVGNSPFDVGGHGQNAGATSFTVSSSAASTDANDIVFGVFGSDAAAAADTFSVGSPYASVANVTIGGGNSGQLLVEKNTPGSTGTQTATATLGTSARASYFVIAIKP